MRSLAEGLVQNAGLGSRNYYETYYSTRDWHWYVTILTDILKRAEPGPILDVGAGVGYFVEACTRWGIECTGIEGSPDAVQMAHDRYPAAKMIQRLLSERFPFGDGSIQSVLMNQVIEHL